MELESALERSNSNISILQESLMKQLEINKSIEEENNNLVITIESNNYRI